MSVKQKSKKMSAKVKQLLLFLLLVVIPWVLVIFYTLTIATPRYVSQSQVVVKQSSDNSVGTGSGLIAMLGGASTSVEDSHYLISHIQSMDMLKILDPQFKFREHYRPTGSDPLSELPENASTEQLLKYYKSRINVEVDPTTQILTISTQGFSPDYTLALNKALLQQSEVFVNRISQQMATDQIVFAEKQLEDATNQLNETKNQLLNYQNKNELLDPEATAKALSSVIAGLEANLSSLRTEERQLLSYLNPDAPQVVSLRSQIKAVEQQLVQERKKLTSPDNSKLNTKALQFEQIKANVAFAEEKYKLALTAMEKTQYEATRKMKKLIVIASPFQAQEAMYPRKAYIIATSLVFLLIFYGFVQLILAVIRDHKD